MGNGHEVTVRVISQPVSDLLVIKGSISGDAYRVNPPILTTQLRWLPPDGKGYVWSGALFQILVHLLWAADGVHAN